MNKFRKKLKLLKLISTISFIGLGITLVAIIFGVIFSQKILLIISISLFVISSYFSSITSLCRYDYCFIDKIVNTIEIEKLTNIRKIAKRLGTNEKAVSDAIRKAKKINCLNDWFFDGENLINNNPSKSEKISLICPNCNAMVKVNKTNKKCCYCGTKINENQDIENTRKKIAKDKEIFIEQTKYSTSKFTQPKNIKINNVDTIESEKLITKENKKPNKTSQKQNKNSTK